MQIQIILKHIIIQEHLLICQGKSAIKNSCILLTIVLARSSVFQFLLQLRSQKERFDKKTLQTVTQTKDWTIMVYWLIHWYGQTYRGLKYPPNIWQHPVIPVKF